MFGDERSPLVEEQVRLQHRLDRQRMTVWIPLIFVAGFFVSVLGLYAYVNVPGGRERSLGMVGVYGVFVLLFGIGTGRWLLWSALIRPRIVPYFSRELEPYGGATTRVFSGGRAAYVDLEALAESAARMNVRPLTAFGFSDDFYGQEVTWHSADAGLRTVEALREDVARRSTRSVGVEDDLQSLELALRMARDRGVDFALLLRLYGRENARDISLIQTRRGSFW